MKPNLLRAPLINSAILLVVCSLLVYFTLTSPEGSIWSSIGAIFTLLFRIAQLVIGLALGLLVCIVVLIGIFLGAVALFDGASASRMYEGLRQTILNWLAPVLDLLSSDSDDKLQVELSDLGRSLKSDFSQMIGSARRELSTAHNELAGKLQALQGKVQATEEATAEKVSTEQLEAVSAEVATVTVALTATEGKIQNLQKSIEQATEKIGAIDPKAILGDVPGRLETLEQQESAAPVDLQPIEEKIAALQAEVKALHSALKEASKPQEQEAVETPAAAVKEEKKEERVEEGAGHRLLSYFEKKADQEKLAGLVAETLKKDMTYAQVMDFLIKEMGKKGGTIISEHPSLAKDYIRQCRRDA
ncbi:MAG: hypothetical protein L3J49_02600 [Desulfobulbaceae bacterium]|nr:hypothetical protein [Desulfobulbaceae bacterium]